MTAASSTAVRGADTAVLTTAALVLAGGRSTRMGRPKALLDWHGSTLVRRAVGLVGRAVEGPVVVVRAAGQTLPSLPPGTEIADDEQEGRGPLQGIASGLRAIAGRADVVFVAGVDTPLLHPALIGHVIGSLGPEDDVALPHAHGFPHPLAAAYRIATVAPLLETLLAEDSLGTRPLMRRCRVRLLDETALLADPDVAALDPELDSLANLNEPAEYEAARERERPAVSVDGRACRATRLAQVGDGPARINDRPADDPDEPLATGDIVLFSRTRGSVRADIAQ
ncbi:MAG: molybdenum cofactor guanylyltransferase [Solirubrobacteraceae bacterium]|nr:molybdenum cofactor guanylyltransferase [Solirubrobacteraceae bacterium]